MAGEFEISPPPSTGQSRLGMPVPMVGDDNREKDNKQLDTYSK